MMPSRHLVEPNPIFRERRFSGTGFMALLHSGACEQEPNPLVVWDKFLMHLSPHMRSPKVARDGP
jgi:hypothetical protein